MKKIITASIVVGALWGFAGCRTVTAVAPTGDAGKVYVTKLTSYVVYTSNKVQSCTLAGSAITNCQDLSVE